MGQQTAIAWTDHTFNPWMGCSKVSPACDNCYAEALGKRTGRVQWGKDAERVVTSDGYWRNPLKWNAAAEHEGRRHRVFCASMADVFEERHDLNSHRNRLWELIEQTPWLDWQLLTKRPELVPLMVPIPWITKAWPANVWMGTTVENQEFADERIPDLLDLPAPVRFLSCEPLLGPLDLVSALPAWLQACGVLSDEYCTSLPPLRYSGIGWVIVGGESGPKHRPLNVEHARIVRNQCVRAGVPFFFKQVGGRTPAAGGDLLDGVQWKQFPKTAVVA